jgi:hypothetical protein
VVSFNLARPEDVKNRNHCSHRLFRLARAFLAEFGREQDITGLKPFVAEWFSLSTYGEPSQPMANEEAWQLFVERYQLVRVVPGKVIAAATEAATNDESLSEGLPPCVVARERSNRLARMFRWLHSYHGGKPFNLSYAIIRRALDLPSNTQAGREAPQPLRPNMSDIPSLEFFTHQHFRQYR